MCNCFNRVADSTYSFTTTYKCATATSFSRKCKITSLQLFSQIPYICFINKLELFQESTWHYLTLFVFTCTTHSQVAQCSPSIIRSFMTTTLTPSMRTTIQGMGFRGNFSTCRKSLDNKYFLSWLMGRFDPETIQIGGKQIQVTEHIVKCVFDLPS
jgi:hypothetical protein